MRGEAQYLKDMGGPWHGGICYIDEEKGSLVSDSGEGSSSSSISLVRHFTTQVLHLNL